MCLQLNLKVVFQQFGAIVWRRQNKILSVLIKTICFDMQTYWKGGEQLVNGGQM